jgi:starvation-inducible DNA-binding protein
MTEICTTPPREGEDKHTADKERLRQDLEAVLGQLFELHVQGVEAHAHFVGTRFTGFQRELEGVVKSVREASNAVADVLRRLDGDSTRHQIMTEVPPAIPGLSPGERCTTAAANMINHRISLLLKTIRRVCNHAGDVDTSTAALLGVIADAVDKQALSLVSKSQRINSTARRDILPSTARRTIDCVPSNAQ